VGLLAQTGAGTTPPEETSKSLVDYIHAGGFVGYLIILLSFAAVALVIRFLLEIRRDRVVPQAAADELLARVRAGNIEGARQYCAQQERPSFLTKVVGSSLQRCAQSPFGLLEVRSAMEEAGQREVDRLFRTTDGIGLIASVGPMMGLLGTVFGMIGAFGTIGNVEGAARSHQLAGYMAVALVTTAEGLLVAIPCTAIYAIFRRRIERLVAEAGEVTEQIASLIERSAEQPGAARPGPVRPVAAVAGAKAS
jgi:biopolymer transport protein ExbB